VGGGDVGWPMEGSEPSGGRCYLSTCIPSHQLALQPSCCARLLGSHCSALTLSGEDGATPSSLKIIGCSTACLSCAGRSRVVTRRGRRNLGA
jgi:hypothetical protein